MRLTLFVFTAVVLCFQTSSAQQQKTLVNYYASLGDDVLNQLDTYAPTTSREKERFNAAKKHLHETFNHMVYDKLVSALQKGKSISFQPLSVLEQHGVTYNDMGFPIPLVAKAAIKKARKRGHEGDLYYSVSLYCTDAASLASVSKLAKQSKPEIKLTINVFDAHGDKVKKAQTKVKGRKPIKAKEFSPKFDKMEMGSMDDLMVKVSELVDQAIEEAVDKL
ncbi:MAG: hypothetical protein KTR24_00970 [Saprospiraceae bacterium]|nr:hypothetical protein [Saprospiraceae bacterium]